MEKTEPHHRRWFTYAALMLLVAIAILLIGRSSSSEAPEPSARQGQE